MFETMRREAPLPMVTVSPVTGDPYYTKVNQNAGNMILEWWKFLLVTGKAPMEEGFNGRGYRVKPRTKTVMVGRRAVQLSVQFLPRGYVEITGRIRGQEVLGAWVVRRSTLRHLRKVS